MTLKLKEHLKVNYVANKCFKYVKRLMILYSVSISTVSIVDLNHKEENRVNWDLETFGCVYSYFLDG